jgi:hypothetical protein
MKHEVLPLLFSLLVVACVSSAQGQKNEETRSRYPLVDPSNVHGIVANVGNIEISAQEFLLSYEFGPAFVKRTRDSKAKYLQFMVYEKLLALDGYARGLQKAPQVRRSLAEVEGDLITEELYKDDVLRNVTITPAELATAVRREQYHLSLRWLYAKTLEDSRQKYRSLLRGASFDSLFIAQLTDSVNADDRSMEITQFALDNKNPLLAKVVDTLQPGRPSRPVEGTDGWYIVKITNGWRNALPSESDYTKLNYDVRRALTQRKADSLSDRYVRKLMLGQNPVIVRTTFNVLRSYVGAELLTSEEISEWGLAQEFAGPHARRDSLMGSAHGEDILVTLANGKIDLRTFLSWYKARDHYFHIGKSSEEAFDASIEQMVWRMVRDRLLIERAMARGLDKREAVRTQKKWWEEKVLYEMVKSTVSEGIHLDEGKLKKYYEEHRRQYVSSKGDTLSFDRAKEDVQNDLYSLELTRQLWQRISKLKQSHTVSIHEDVLRTVPVDVESDPKAIDVYPVKKGGTFPRPAFPSIDYQWRTWN